MECPKCKSAMEPVTFEGVEVDRCVKCRGIWFDALEQEHLKAMKGSEIIDTAAPAGRPKSPAKQTLDCPVCHARMIEMVDHQQPHIHFESCTVCYGAFFDCGEFRDYKEHTLGEWMRGLFGKR